MEIGDTVTLLRYDVTKKEWVRSRNYDVLQNLRFANREFYLLYKDNQYCMATYGGKSLYCVWKKSEYIGKHDSLFPGEATSEFRKGFMKNKITNEMVDMLINEPESYKKAYRKDLSAEETDPKEAKKRRNAVK